MKHEAQAPLFPGPAQPLEFRLAHYLGSKLRLMKPIRDVVEQLVPIGGRVYDLFSAPRENGGATISFLTRRFHLLTPAEARRRLRLGGTRPR